MVVEADTDDGQASEVELPQIPELFGPDEQYIPFPGENNNNWVFDQIACHLGLDDPDVVVDDANHPAQLDSVGLWFQVLDSEYSGTIAAGAIAPFSSDTESIIQDMRPEGGLKLDERCSPVPFD